MQTKVFLLQAFGRGRAHTIRVAESRQERREGYEEHYGGLASPAWYPSRTLYTSKLRPFGGLASAAENVFGYFPSPQTLKDPKSLYQSPSGASGSVSATVSTD